MNKHKIQISALILFLFIILTFIIITCSLPPKTLPNSDSGIDTVDILDASVDTNKNDDAAQQDIENDNNTIDTNDTINIDITNDEIDIVNDTTIEDSIFTDGIPCEPCLPDETCNTETGLCEKEGYGCFEIFSCVMENGAEQILSCAEGGSADGRREFGSLVACLMEECFNEFIGGNEMEIMTCASNNCSEQVGNCMF